MEVETTSVLARGGTRYSSTSSLSSAATANSPQQTTIPTPTSISNNGTSGPNNNGTNHQVATAAVVCQTQGLNLAQRESPPKLSAPTQVCQNLRFLHEFGTIKSYFLIQEKVAITQTVVQTTQVPPSSTTTTTQLHVPISAQMLSTNQGLATIVPSCLQQFGPGIRVIPSDGRQLIVQSNGTVGGPNNGEARSVALVVHSTSANNENRVTFVHSTGSERPLALAVQSAGSTDVRPVTIVSGNEARPIVLTAAHAPTINVTS